MHCRKWFSRLLVLLASLAITACFSDGDGEVELPGAELFDVLNVYKSPTCGCCGDWIDHMESYGFSAESFHPEDLEGLKSRKGIAPQYRSCHTAVSVDGFVFEGHVPAKYVQQFLQEKPADAIGLSVPAMPVGSPGMEIGDQFSPYQVLLLKLDGSAEVYANVLSPADQ